MIDNFAKSLAFVLEDEGGNSDDPDDHGGRTSRGITQREFDAYRKLHSLPLEDVWVAANSEIASIYLDHYWKPWCDKMPTGLDYCYFDMAVNAGPNRATVLLQRAIGIADDGVFGPVTLLSATRVNPKLLIPEFSNERENFYRSLRQPKFLNGWLNRTHRVEDRAMAMIQGET